MKILVTGAAGFIGSHLSKKLIKDGNQVLGIDNFNTYYDVDLKYSRLNKFVNHRNFICKNIDLCDKSQLEEIFKNNNFDTVVNLAAQAGVRYSITNPQSYLDSNLIGFMNILEAVRNYEIPHLIYASSSSVYGNSDNIPYSESQNINKPISLYAATKISNEVMASSYSHLYDFSTTGLRFFTVYGPWGRPDMAYFKFTKNILEGKKIDIYNKGKMYRDYTYIDDIVNGIYKLINKPPSLNQKTKYKNDSLSPIAPYRILNIGNTKKIYLLKFINTLEKELNKKIKRIYLPMQKGDVYSTLSDSSLLKRITGYNPQTDYKTGIKKFINWYKNFYH